MQIRSKVGDKFGTLTVSRLIKGGNNPKAEFICDCGKVNIAIRGEVANGRWHCKCMSRSIPRAPKTPAQLHASAQAKARLRMYRRWRNVKARCENPKNKYYKDYGGRGIRTEWVDFESIYADMGDPPDGLQLERIDNNGNYSKSNCVWASIGEQSINKRNSKRWLIHGVEYLSLAYAANALGVTSSTVLERMGGRTRANGVTTVPWPGYSFRPLYSAKTVMPSAIDITKIHEKPKGESMNKTNYTGEP